jgi:trehalose synthase
MEQLARSVVPGDVVICHDPQTAGLVPHLAKLGARVVWRCHIGHEAPGRDVDAGWAFLRRYLAHVPFAVFTRDAYAPSWLPRARAVTLPPSIDPFSVKNQWMPELTVRAILTRTGLLESDAHAAQAVFVRENGTTGQVKRLAEVSRTGDAPHWKTPLVVQVSRWDRMKDHIGVLAGFAQLMRQSGDLGAELILAGPATTAVADDPEGPEVLREVEQAWRSLPDTARRRVQIAQLPMDDTDENAAMVNALQRHATVIVQKSLREGFGLTVTEALWKKRPVVASAVGGIQDQITDGVDGLLIRNPADPQESADALRRVLASPELGSRLGTAAYDRVRQHYLSISSLERWAQLVRALLGADLHQRAPAAAS